MGTPSRILLCLLLTLAVVGCPAEEGVLPEPEECLDEDGDEYPGNADESSGLLDCDDSDPDVNPGVEETCGNGVDDNCDGLVDGEDPDCAGDDDTMDDDDSTEGDDDDGGDNGNRDW